jgi:hypothetical protein
VSQRKTAGLEEADLLSLSPQDLERVIQQRVADIRRRDVPKKNAQHSSTTPEWGSPSVVVNLARHVLGGIDLDPCSNAYWNRHLVKATSFYDKEQNALVRHWTGRVYLNPPGELGGVRVFWEHLAEQHRSSRTRGAVWCGFSLEQIGYLQGSPTHPLQWVTCVPCERLPFMQRDPRGGPPTPEGSPTHSNYITLLPDMGSRSERRAQVGRFRDFVRSLSGGAWGAIVRPVP